MLVSLCLSILALVEKGPSDSRTLPQLVRLWRQRTLLQRHLPSLLPFAKPIAPLSLRIDQTLSSQSFSSCLWWRLHQDCRDTSIFLLREPKLSSNSKTCSFWWKNWELLRVFSNEKFKECVETIQFNRSVAIVCDRGFFRSFSCLLYQNGWATAFGLRDIMEIIHSCWSDKWRHCSCLVWCLESQLTRMVSMLFVMLRSLFPYSEAVTIFLLKPINSLKSPFVTSTWKSAANSISTPKLFSSLMRGMLSLGWLSASVCLW